MKEENASFQTHYYLTSLSESILTVERNIERWSILNR